MRQRKAKARLAKLEANNSANYVRTLADTLRFLNRRTESVRLLEAHLGLTLDDYNALDLADRLVPRLHRLETNNAALLVTALADSLRLVNRNAECVRLLESYLRWEPDVYAAVGLADLLTERLAALTIANAASLVFVLADSLRLADRPEESVRVLESYLRLERHGHAASYLTDQLEERLAGLEANCAANIVRILAVGLVDRPTESVQLLEKHLGLERDDYTASDLIDRLDERLSGLEVNNAANLVITLVAALGEADCIPSAGHLLVAYCGKFEWLNARNSGPSPETTVLLMQCYLSELLHFTHGRAPLDACCQLLPFLRRALRRPGTTTEDRKRFARSLGDLRERMISVLNFAAMAQTDPKMAAEWRWQAIQTDVELGQRALFEQFVAGDYVIVAADDGASLPVPGWPFPEASRTWQRFRNWSGQDFDPRCNALAFAAFDAVDDESVATVPPPEMLGARRKPQEWLAQAEQEVAEGIDESRLARVLGCNTLFLRVMFDSDGTLRWWAVCSDGERLTLLADNLSARSNSLDLDRLRWATALHDLEVECEYLLARMSTPETLLSDLRCRADKVTEALSETDFLDGMGRYLHEFLQPFNRAVGLSLIPLLNPPSSDSERESWRQRTAVWWSKVVDFLATLEREAGKWGSATRLDDSTRRYLDQVSEVWKLEPLAKALRDQTQTGTDAAEIDLVVQVDDVLHAVPVPHLIVGDRPLFELVRSCRVSLSVLLDTLQERLELKAQQRQPNSRRMLAVSWFDPGDPTDPTKPGDPAGEGAVLLHHLHSQTADEFGLQYLAAAEDPPARRGTLLRALDDEGYSVATILGHGSWLQAGVHFADQLWNGQGWTLDGVEFLIIPSCSIGRVQQTGVRDVEGFCVTLALHQARAALACRWKVNAAEAPYFADEVARQYLELRKDSSPDIPGACLRARAVNLARKKLLANNHRSGHTHVGLNTATAFELYGRG